MDFFLCMIIPFHANAARRHVSVAAEGAGINFLRAGPNGRLACATNLVNQDDTLKWTELRVVSMMPAWRRAGRGQRGCARGSDPQSTIPISTRPILTFQNLIGRLSDVSGVRLGDLAADLSVPNSAHPQGIADRGPERFSAAPRRPDVNLRIGAWHIRTIFWQGSATRPSYSRTGRLD